MEKTIKIIRNYFHVKLEMLGKETSMFIIALIFMFTAIYFWINKFSNEYYLFLVFTFGVLSFMFLIPLLKLFLTMKGEIAGNEEINSKESKNINITNFDVNEFSEFFLGNSFVEFERISFSNNIISEEGKWTFGRKRDISLLLAVLVENGILKFQSDYTKLHLVCENYFKSNFDYSEMTTVIKDILENDVKHRDEKIYAKFTSLYVIKT